VRHRSRLSPFFSAASAEAVKNHVINSKPGFVRSLQD
jgi:hypothetical protein